MCRATHWLRCATSHPADHRLVAFALPFQLPNLFAADQPSISIVDSDTIRRSPHRRSPLLRYNKAHVEPPAGVNRNSAAVRIHPVWTPSGAIVTDELPPDHLHQSGIFLAFTKTPV